MITDDSFFNMPGRIVEYFPATQTATVRICIERNFDSATTLGELKERVLLQDVPVHTAAGGGWALTHPIKPNDTCILFFSQVGYDHWLYEDKDTAGTFKGQPMFWSNRRFGVEDGYALVGLNTLPRAIPDYHATDSEWRNVDREQRVSLQADGNLLIKSGSTTINLAPSGNITIHTDKSLDITADASTTLTSPIVTVNASTSATVNTPIVTVNATASATVNTTLAVVNATTSAAFTTPLLSISGNLIVGGGIAAGVPIGSPVLPGMSIVGPVEIDGLVSSTGLISSVTGLQTDGDMIANNISFAAHTHTSASPGSPTSPPIP